MMNMKNEEFRKNRFKTQVVTYMEQLTKDRRIQIRTQKLNDILYFNNVKIDFQERVKYIDSNEFNHMIDTYMNSHCSKIVTI